MQGRSGLPWPCEALEGRLCATVCTLACVDVRRCSPGNVPIDADPGLGMGPDSGLDLFCRLHVRLVRLQAEERTAGQSSTAACQRIE